jgi:hypothetical protein
MRFCRGIVECVLVMAGAPVVGRTDLPALASGSFADLRCAMGKVETTNG